jgi:beta-glucanase (GH16 family)
MLAREIEHMDIARANKTSTRVTSRRVSKVVTLTATSAIIISIAGFAAGASTNQYTPAKLASGTFSFTNTVLTSNDSPLRHHRSPTTTTTLPAGTTTTLPAGTTTTLPAPTTTTLPPTTTTTLPAGTTTTLPAGTTTTLPAGTTTTLPAPTTTTTVRATTTTVVSNSPQPVGNISGNWNLAFGSEFNGPALDSSQWSTGWFGSGITKGINSAETECMDPSQVTLVNGALNLTAIAKAETCSGVTQPYTSGMVTTNGRFTFTYGFMEARIWLPGTTSISDWPAFWADGQSWPTNGENDVVEGLGGLAQAHFHNASGTLGPLTGRGTFTGGWHTFAADWEPGSVTYFYDGVKLGSFTSGITSAPMYLILDMAVSGSSVFTPATMKVDYVRVWQH